MNNKNKCNRYATKRKIRKSRCRQDHERVPPTAEYRIPDQKLFLSDRCLRCRKSCDGYTERRAGYIIQTDLVAELNGRGISAVLSADSKMQARVNRLAEFDCHLHQLANAILIQLSEGIVL